MISPAENFLSSPPSHPSIHPQREPLRHSFPELGNTAHQLRSTAHTQSKQLETIPIRSTNPNHIKKSAGVILLPTQIILGSISGGSKSLL